MRPINETLDNTILKCHLF